MNILILPPSFRTNRKKILMKKKFTLTVCFATLSWFAFAQSYNLQQLFKENKFDVVAKNTVPLTDGDKKGITTDGNLWLKGVTF
jgi:hypothetical protein